MNKSYARLGEAYYDASTAGKPVEGMNDVLNLIKSNRELIQLLNEKLAALDQQQAQEEKEETASDTAAPSSSTDTTAQETAAAPEEKSEPDTSDSNEIHID